MERIWICKGITAIPFILLIGAVGIITRCAQYPANPSKEPAPEKRVVVRHIRTDYISVTDRESQLITNKVNLLTFQITPEHFNCKALEFCGRATLCGPPSLQTHVLHFRTDRAIDKTEGIDTPPNIIDTIQSGSTITLFRIKYPTNEYAPFEGDQGKIVSLEILDAWAVDAKENRTPVQVALETN